MKIGFDMTIRFSFVEKYIFLFFVKPQLWM